VHVDAPATLPGRGRVAPPPPAAEEAAREETAPLVLRARLVGLSFLMLFVELALIRWSASNNIHLAYLTNFVLLGSFLGVGAGFLAARRRLELFPFAPVVLALLVAFVLAFPVRMPALGSHAYQLRGNFGSSPIDKWISLPVIFVLAVATLACIGQAVARIFVRLRPLEAYRLDILGSIAGIVVFSGLAFLRLPPLAWGSLAAVGLLALGTRWPRWWQWAGVAAIVTLLAVESLSPHDHWSPYYKVTATPIAGKSKVAGINTHDIVVVSANGIPHQTAYPVDTLHKLERFYLFPYRHVTGPLRNVLIVGAGTGNDVAVALSEGAQHVDAVEIDPVIQSLGRKYHPDHPYQDPRVSVHIDDGRAFLERTGTHYDLILFALPDSLTLLAGQSNLRLENYLFTIEAMRSARAHLQPHGTFTMYNYYEPFLLDRYAGQLETVYGTAPCAERGDTSGARQQAVLTASHAGPTPNCKKPWHGQRLEAATDDHPFPYLPGREIPKFYLWWLLFVLGVSAVVIAIAAGRAARGMARYADLAFMGGAFLLLETKNVVQFALLFGTTWFVNSLVFAGVLISVFLAVEVARRVPLPRAPVLYALLLGALALAWAVPQSSLLSLSPGVRFAAAAALAFAPIFLANLVFAQRFRAVASSTTAFGANLLGAMMGGVLEYLALITGYRMLLVLVAGLYGLAFLTSRLLQTARA
jgi:Spermine/spermidine synthase domain